MDSLMQLYDASCMADVSFVHDGRVPFTTGARVSRVLLAIDDLEALETLALLLADSGVAVEAAPTIEACVRALDWGMFDLFVVEQRFDGATGLDVVRDLRARGLTCSFVLVAGRAAVAEVVEAMHVGARTVIAADTGPADVADAIVRELRALAAAQQSVSAVTLASSMSGAPARRWAGYVLAASNATEDPRTLADWSRAIGVSRSVLVESCARLGIVPRDARDLARVLRLVRRADEPWDPETALDVADRRTLHALLVRAGLIGHVPHVRPTIGQFLARQLFVVQENVGLIALRQLLDQ
jgi:ActR/RegA family two-component response regulator